MSDADWMGDAREIISVRLPAETRDYARGTGDRFERIHYAGEYCYLPWLRITTSFSTRGIYGGPIRTFEIPLSAVAMIEFSDLKDTSND